MLGLLAGMGGLVTTGRHCVPSYAVGVQPDRLCLACGRDLRGAALRCGVDDEDGRRWAIFGRCSNHGNIGAPEGDGLADLQPVPAGLRAVGGYYAGSVNGRVALWPYRGPDGPEVGRLVG
jgi:hypothetical protein